MKRHASKINTPEISSIRRIGVFYWTAMICIEDHLWCGFGWLEGVCKGTVIPSEVRHSTPWRICGVHLCWDREMVTPLGVM
jgi:hypothetical protein